MFEKWSELSRAMLNPTRLLDFAQSEGFEWKDPNHIPTKSRRALLMEEGAMYSDGTLFDKSKEQLISPPRK